MNEVTFMVLETLLIMCMGYGTGKILEALIKPWNKERKKRK